MSFETSPFGKADGSNVDGTVHNHYGERVVGGQRGNVKTEGLYSEYKISAVDSGLDHAFPLPAGCVITEVVDDFATGAITTLTIGGQNIAGANGTAASYVKLSGANTGAIVLAGPTAGYVLVKYLKAPA